MSNWNITFLSSYYFCHHLAPALLMYLSDSSQTIPSLQSPWSFSPLIITQLFHSPAFSACFPPLAPGFPDSSSAGVFPELRGFRSIRPVSGRGGLPHGADALLVHDPHVGRQLPHRHAPPRGSAHICLRKDPLPAQHQRHQLRRGRRSNPAKGTDSSFSAGKPRVGFHFFRSDTIPTQIWTNPSASD